MTLVNTPEAMKGVLICGGTGTRLRPLTEVTNKSLLPVYDKPLVLYPLQTLLDAGIEDIIVITGNEHIDQMAGFLGSGSRFHCRFSYRVQDKPEGIAQALGMAEEFADGDNVCAILGDNIYFDALSRHIRSFERGGHIFVKEVPNPERFGVAKFWGDRVVSLEEKPLKPKSNFAQTGCYVFDARCFEVIRNLKPSGRGELEITDVTKWFMEQGELTVTILQDAWIDAGTFESLHQAAREVRQRKRERAESAKSAAVQSSEKAPVAPS